MKIICFPKIRNIEPQEKVHFLLSTLISTQNLLKSWAADSQVEFEITGPQKVWSCKSAGEIRDIECIKSYELGMGYYYSNFEYRYMENAFSQSCAPLLRKNLFQSYSRPLLSRYRGNWPSAICLLYLKRRFWRKIS